MYESTASAQSNFLRSKLGRSFLYWFLGISLIPLSIFTVAIYNKTYDEVLNSKLESLRTSSDIEEEKIELFFNHHVNNIHFQSKNRPNRDLLLKIRNSFIDSKKSLDEFIKSYEWAGLTAPDGSGQDLKSFRDQYGYYDVFLIDQDLNILFTVNSRKDLGTNLMSGKFSETKFGKTCQHVLITGEASFSDLEYYEPTAEASSFLVEAILDEEAEVIGLFALQFHEGTFDKKLQSESQLDEVFFLVGQNGLLRTDPTPDNGIREILNQNHSVETALVRGWQELLEEKKSLTTEEFKYKIIKLNETHNFYQNKSGQKFVGTLHHVDVLGVPLAIIAQVNESILFESINNLKNFSIVVVTVTLMFILFISFIVVGRIVKPVLQLKLASEQLAKGELDHDIPVDRNDELGKLISSFNEMRRVLEVGKNELEESEQRIRSIIDSAVDAIISIDKKGSLLTFNPAAEKMFGYTFDEVENKNINILMPSPYHEEHDDYLQNYAQTLIKKIIGSGREVQGKRKDGSVFPIHLSVSEAQIGYEKIFTGVVRDVSEVKALQKEQEKITQDLQVKERVQTFLSDFNDVTRGDLNAASLSKNILDYLAYQFNAVVGSFYLVHDQNNLTVAAGFAVDKDFLKSNIEFGSGIVGEVALKKQPLFLKEVPSDYIKISSSLGERTPRHIFVFPFLREGRLKGVVELGTLEEFSNEQLNLLEEAHLGVSISLEAAIAREGTQKLLKQTQRQSEELQRQQEELASQNEELEQHSQQLKASEKELQSQSEELKASNEELEEKSKSLEKQSQELVRSNIELNSAKSFVEDKANELELSSQYKSEFLANMSHELRTPLNSSLLLAKKLAANDTGNLTEKQVKSAQIIYEGGKDLLKLINDILDLSKVEAGRLDLEIDDVPLEKVVENLNSLFEPVVRQKKMEFKTEVKEGAPKTIETDSLRLEQILKNFISNALKFTEKGSVSVQIFVPKIKKDVVAFSIIDTGIGIPKERQAVIFEAFRQADGSTTRKYGGTGLGLTISREMASLLGGEIELESEEGKGSTFTLLIPRKFKGKGENVTLNISNSKEIDAHEIQDELQNKLTSKITQKTVESNYIPDDRRSIESQDKVLLIVEDDRHFAEILMEQGRMEGYKCLCAAAGREGLILAREFLPRAILLDLGLPDIDGLAVLEALKSDLETRHIPVHVISGRDKERSSLQKGAINYLKKPLDAKDLEDTFSRIEKFNDSRERKLLLIEDDKHSQTSIVSLIEQDDLTIEVVGTGEEGFQKLSRSSYDCVIMDLNLPDISGFDLLKKCNTSNISMPPVIVYSGRDLSKKEFDELNRNAQSVVVKGTESPERLVDEVTLFLHSLESQLPESQKKIIHMLHKSDEVLRGKKILLVDDDMRNIFALSGVLEDQGLHVVVAENGKIAIEKLQQEKNIDLVLMDIMMPIMDGYEAMKKIREMKKFKKLPIISLTAKAMKGDRDKCIEAGANDYLPKPVQEEKLLSLLRVWLFNNVGK